MSELIHLQPLVDMIALTLQTKFIKNEKNGTSLLIIARPETAKTTLACAFSNLDFVSYYDEVTQKKMIDEFLPLIRAGQKRTLIVPDLVNCIQKQKSTREQFLNMIKTGIDDTGIKQISTYHKQMQYLDLVDGLKFNMITATTTANYIHLEKEIKDTGLLSRYAPFAFDLPINMIANIFEVLEGCPAKPADKITIPKLYLRDMDIPNNPTLFKSFEIVSRSLGMRYGGFGFRAQTALQRLAKASAIIDKRKEVEKSDIEKVMQLCRWINYDFNPL